MSSSTDPTELARRDLMPAMADEAAAAVAAGERTWKTEELCAEFEVMGFSAPLVVARRRSDAAVGSLYFRGTPRLYFGWVPHRSDAGRG